MQPMDEHEKEGLKEEGTADTSTGDRQHLEDSVNESTEAETLISTNLEQEENEPKTLAEDTTANTEFAVAQTDAGGDATDLRSAGDSVAADRGMGKESTNATGRPRKVSTSQVQEKLATAEAQSEQLASQEVPNYTEHHGVRFQPNFSAYDRAEAEISTKDLAREQQHHKQLPYGTANNQRLFGQLPPTHVPYGRSIYGHPPYEQPSSAQAPHPEQLRGTRHSPLDAPMGLFPTIPGAVYGQDPARRNPNLNDSFDGEIITNVPQFSPKILEDQLKGATVGKRKNRCC